MKKILFTILTILIICSNLLIVSACTIFNATMDGVTMVGNNEDWFDKDAKVWFLPAEQGKFGRVFFGFKGAGPEGGMNEKGLFFDWVAFEDRKMAPESPQKLDYPGSLSEKIIEECSTVSQALEMYKKYNEPNFGYAEIMLADSGGASAAVTWDWGKSEIKITKKSGSFQTLGYGDSIVNNEFMYDSNDISVERFRRLLNEAHQGELTIYSNTYDLNKKEVYVYYLHNYENRIKFDLEDELKKGKHFYNLYDLFPGQRSKMAIKDYFFKDLSKEEAILLIVLIIVFAAPFIAWPVYYLIRRYSKEDRNTYKAGEVLRISWIVTILNSILGLLMLYLILRYGPFLAKYGYEIMGITFAHLPFYIILLTVGQILTLVFAWMHKLWSLTLRIFFSIAAVFSVFFIILLKIWNLLLI